MKEKISWPTVRAIASNSGTRPAVDVLLKIVAQGSISIFDAKVEKDDEDGEQHGDRKVSARRRLTLPLPPVPPRGVVKTFDSYGFSPNFAGDIFAKARALSEGLPRFTPPLRRQSDAFYWRTGERGWVDLMELECECWRHNQNEVAFFLKVRPEHQTDVSGAIELSVHANNVSRPPHARLPVRIAFVDGSTIDEARALVEQFGLAEEGTSSG